MTYTDLLIVIVVVLALFRLALAFARREMKREEKQDRANHKKLPTSCDVAASQRETLGRGKGSLI